MPSCALHHKADKGHSLATTSTRTLTLEIKAMNLKYTLLSVIFLIGISLSAQSKKPVQSSSEILVHGTSSLHDWTSNCQEYSGSAVLKVEDGKLTGMSDLNLQIVVKGIKSGNKLWNRIQ